MMRYVSNNSFLISEQQLRDELSNMILAYLAQKIAFKKNIEIIY